MRIDAVSVDIVAWRASQKAAAMVIDLQHQQGRPPMEKAERPQR
jgi:hypothetical protein